MIGDGPPSVVLDDVFDQSNSSPIDEVELLPLMRDHWWVAEDIDTRPSFTAHGKSLVPTMI